MNIHELLVIAIVAVIVFKPEHLPEVARLVGKAMGRCKKILEENLKI